jgi:DNA polymerase III subunit delta
VFYVFHGEDEFSRAEELARLRARMAGGDQAMAELNTSLLDGSRVTMAELRHVCDTIPFLADRRLVIVRGLLTRLAKGSTQEEESGGRQRFVGQLLDYLPGLPDTTRLIFLEDVALPASHPILKLAIAEERGKRGFARRFDLPKEWEVPRWIQERASAKGGRMEREAADLLAALVGPDLRLLDQEIEKLTLHAGESAVSADDVRILVSRARETSIFDLVDCVGHRETGRALRLLHALLEDGLAPLYLLSMLARQIRILIQVSELRQQGLAQPDIVSRLKLHSYVIDKGLAQAAGFTLDQLQAAHRRLIEADWTIKTGQVPEVLALDLLVVDLTRV